MMQRTFRSTFVAGLFICLPLAVTIWTIQFVFSRVEQLLTPIVMDLGILMGLGPWLKAAWADYAAPVVSVALGVLAIWFVGLVGGNVLGRQLLRGLERLVLQVPVVRSIYGATRQFIEAFSPGAGRSFSRVVLVQYPRPGVWTLGLVTNTHNEDISQQVGTAVVSVFMPTTPNPTSGWLAFVPDNELISLTMSVDDAFKLIVSGGVLGNKAATPNVPLPANEPLPPL
jgi:uncharacterized membrane protein